MNIQALLAALKGLLPALEPEVAKEVDALIQQGEAAADAKIGSPDLKLAADAFMAAAQKVIDAELAKI